MGFQILNIFHILYVGVGQKLANESFVAFHAIFSVCLQILRFLAILPYWRAKRRIYCREKIDSEKTEFRSDEGHEVIRDGA